MRYDLIVVGGGPAGLFSAICCAKSGMSVLLLESNEKLGKKLLVSGSGQCNLTNSESVKEMIQHYGDQRNFVKKALNAFKPDDLIGYFRSHDLDVEIMDNGKVFPITRKSTDVLELLVKDGVNHGLKIQTKEAVEQIKMLDERFVVNTAKESYQSEYLIISTGGKSFPHLGATGDGYKFAESFGHEIVSPKPSLTPVFNKKFKLSILSGLSFQDTEVSLWRDGKKKRVMRDDLLITHKGLSGPVIINNSRYFVNGDMLQISFIDGDSHQFVRNCLRDGVDGNKKVIVKKFIESLGLPKRLVHALLDEVEISTELKIAELTKTKRKMLFDQLSAYPFEIEMVGDLNVAMATSGGINTSQVSGKTYESKLQKKLYFAGEVLDVDGDTGGYNIQFAFSSAWLASQAIIKER